MVRCGVFVGEGSTGIVIARPRWDRPDGFEYIALRGIDQRQLRLQISLVVLQLTVMENPYCARLVSH